MSRSMSSLGRRHARRASRPTIGHLRRARHHDPLDVYQPFEELAPRTGPTMNGPLAGSARVRGDGNGPGGRRVSRRRLHLRRARLRRAEEARRVCLGAEPREALRARRARRRCRHRRERPATAWPTIPVCANTRTPASGRSCRPSPRRELERLVDVEGRDAELAQVPMLSASTLSACARRRARRGSSDGEPLAPRGGYGSPPVRRSASGRAPPPPRDGDVADRLLRLISVHLRVEHEPVGARVDRRAPASRLEAIEERRRMALLLSSAAKLPSCSQRSVPRVVERRHLARRRVPMQAGRNRRTSAQRRRGRMRGTERGTKRGDSDHGRMARTTM